MSSDTPPVPSEDGMAYVMRRLNMVGAVMSILTLVASLAFTFASTKYAISQKAEREELARVATRSDSIDAAMTTTLIKLNDGQDELSVKQDQMNNRLRQLICEALRAGERACRLVQ